MPRVFLSYAQPDGALATRVFSDLTRTRVGEVWCYQISSEYGADFRDEYAKCIRSSDVFLLFDSQHARKSSSVKDEVEICLGTPGIAFLICLCEPTGAWREAELFEGQNRRVYFELLDYYSG